ncbi:MAG: putative pre-16S rRNA nuclease [Chlamydiia bacterium]|nr:putative pre-16S rRNA nuclease [Chlamydiia bacterium]MCH9618035.1 putative pre-16S rRNA nuclease [Chlamydiia bacterium]MCH9623640.1 putative pre-16S rRNA nuclease [Chlamydiia bacterium]
MNVKEEFIVGIDFGLRRIGLAVCRKGVSFALPGDTMQSKKTDLDTIKAIIDSYNEKIDRFVLGLPVYLDGNQSDMTVRVEKFGKVLEEYSNKPVHYMDERLTSEHSDDLLKEMGLNRKERIPYKDSLAAQLILKDFLSMHES